MGVGEEHFSAMNMKTPWDYLRCGKIELGLNAIRKHYELNPSASHTMELGVAYLWMGNYVAAEQLFQHAIKTDPTPGDIFYGMVGTAMWSMNHPELAVRCWQSGLDAPYAVGGVGFKLPLLLFLTSVLRPGVYNRQKAEEILLKRIENPRASSWPGPLAQFIVGQIDKTTLEKAWIGNLGQKVRGILPQLKWVTELYEVALQVARGSWSLARFQQQMQHMVDISQPEWSDERNFLLLLWHPEFFVARHEASLIKN